MKNMFNIFDKKPALPMFETLGQFEQYQVMLIDCPVVDVNITWAVAIIDITKLELDHQSLQFNECVVHSFVHKMPGIHAMMSNHMQEIVEREKRIMLNKAEKFIMDRLLDEKIEKVLLDGSQD